MLSAPLDYDICCAFESVGTLWAREQANADDMGVGMVEQMMAVLRRYAAHEQSDGDSPFDMDY